MGVNETSYPRVTVYLKKAHIEFLDKIVSDIHNDDETKINRSDLVRAILDHFCNSKDNKSRALYKEFLKKTNK